MKLTPSGVDAHNQLRLDRDGAGAGAEWTPPLLSPWIQVKRYNTNMDLELDLDSEWTPHNQLRLDRDWTGAGVRVDPVSSLNSVQKVQHKYGSGVGSRSRVDPQSAEVRQRWDWSWSWSGPPTTKISLGETYMVPELEWNLNSSQKVQPTHGSGSGFDPPTHELR